MSIYRKIYETFYGPIPKDENGRTYDIHHIDGNRSNNNILNLIALSIQDHYDVHYHQGDWMACHRLSKRMNLSPKEISELGTKAQKKRVEEGTHNFLGPENNRQKIIKGIHPFVGPELNMKKIANGTHIFLDPDFIKENARRSSERNKEKARNGTHHFLGGEIARRNMRKRVSEGTHHFVKNNPGLIEWTCDHCGKSGKGKSNLTRHHGDNCKFKSEFQA
jgi:hypothetical protein